MINADHSVLYEHYPLHLLLGNKKAATEYSVTAFSYDDMARLERLLRASCPTPFGSSAKDADV